MNPIGRQYLSIAQLAELTPWTINSIEKMVRRGVLVRGIHYFQPGGRRGRLVFKWDPIVAFIEGQSVQPDLQHVVDRGNRTSIVSRRRVLDVEKATTKLQRLLG